MSQLRSQSGLSLMEVLIAAAITAALLTMVYGFAIRSYRSYRFSEAQSEAITAVTSLVTRVGKVVRGTTDIADAQTNTLVIYGYFDPNDATPSKIRYFVDGTQLKVGVIPASGSPPDYTYLDSDEVVTVMRSDLSLGSESVFKYYDETGVQLGGGFGLAQVKQVGIYLAINPKPHILPKALSNQTRVTLRNKKTNL